MKNNITELVLVIDASGSMNPLKADTVGGVNSVIEEQKKNKKDGNVLVNLVTFNNTSRVVYDRVDINKVKPFGDADYHIGGCTALYDAVCGSIKKISAIHKYIRKEDVPNKTVFVIITDGLENASVNFRGKDVKRMIEQKKEDGWEFIFLGANIDTEETARDLGVDADHAISWLADGESVRHVYSGLNTFMESARSDISYSRECFELVDRDYKERKKK